MSDIERHFPTEPQVLRSTVDSASAEKRRVGRPPAHDAQSARLQIIVHTQRYMRHHSPDRFQRRDVAACANVIPALISYYFPQKCDLFFEASSPIIEGYCCAVSDVILSDCALNEKFRSITREFINFNFHTGSTLEFYLYAIRNSDRGAEIINLANHYMLLNAFFSDLLKLNGRHGVDPDFVQSCLWAQCKYLSQQPHIQGISSDSELSSALERLSVQTIALFENGVL